MSTFYGGPQLASVTSVQGNLVLSSFLNSSSVIYTVPAGFNVEIKGSYNPTSQVSEYALKINGITVSVTSIGAGGNIVDEEKYINLFLPSGSTIAFSTIGTDPCKVSYYLGIQLYKNP